MKNVVCDICGTINMYPCSWIKVNPIALWANAERLALITDVCPACVVIISNKFNRIIRDMQEEYDNA